MYSIPTHTAPTHTPVSETMSQIAHSGSESVQSCPQDSRAEGRDRPIWECVCVCVCVCACASSSPLDKWAWVQGRGEPSLPPTKLAL